jgi:hypothetical protein
MNRDLFASLMKRGFCGILLSWMLSVFCCTWDSACSAQKTFTIQLSESAGLPSSTVYDLLLDSKGFMWCVTRYGLTRYDGFQFKNYHNDNQTSLPGSAINEDKYGRIWYQNFDGYLYYVEKDALKSLPQQTPAEFVPFGIVKDYLFVVQQKGVDVFDLKTLSLLQTIPVGAENIMSSTVLNDAYFFLSENVLYKLDDQLKASSMKRFSEQGVKVNLLSNNGQELYMLYKNSDEHEVFFVNPELEFVRTGKLPFRGNVLVTQYQNSQYWFYTSSGAYALNAMFNLAFDARALGVNAILNKCVIDSQGEYWFSSLGEGIIRVESFDNKVLYQHGSRLRNIIKHKDGFLVSDDLGRILALHQDFTFHKVVVDIGVNNPILNFNWDDESELLFVTTSQEHAIYYQGKKIYSGDMAVKHVVRLDENYFALSASGYVVLLKNPIASQATSIWNDLFVKQSKDGKMAQVLTNLRAKTVAFNWKESALYTCTNSGVFKITPDGKITEVLVNGKRSLMSRLFFIDDMTFGFDNIGNLYEIGEDYASVNLNTQLGIDRNAIQMVKQFEDCLYALGMNHIIEYRVNQPSARVQTIEVGPAKVNDLLKLKDKLVVVTGSDIISLRYGTTDVKNVPGFYLNRIYVGQQNVDQVDLRELRYNQNNLRITFSVVDLAGGLEPNLFYRINHNDWLQLPAHMRELVLSSLAPGEYHLDFRVNDFVHANALEFNITPPVYKQTWFIILAAVVIALILLAIHKWILFMLRKKMNLINEKTELEGRLRSSMLTSIKAQMNPHFFYNALNTIQAYIFSNDRNNAITYLSKFSKLTRLILEMSDKQMVRLEEELQSLKLYLELEQARFQNDFTFDFTLDESIDKRMIEIPSMLIQPYVENAVKHGLLHQVGHKHVLIEFELRKGVLQVVIDDNGIGRERSEEINNNKYNKPKSFSTESNKTRLELINQNKNVVSVNYIDKENEHGESKGTTVILSISINDEAI